MTFQNGSFEGWRFCPVCNVSLTASCAHAHILARQPKIRQRALELQEKYGDPVQNLADFLGSLPGSDEDWMALVEEP